MPFRIFRVRPDDDGALDELNRFLASKRVVAVDRHLARAESDPTLIFVVEHTGAASANPAKSSPKIDYREVLTDDEFEVFSALRDIRREVAQSSGKPVYTVFTNAELAAMVLGVVHTRDGLAGLDGVGAGRVEQYAEAFLPTLESWAGKQAAEEAGKA